MKVHTVRLAATMALSFGITCGVPALAGAEPEALEAVLTPVVRALVEQA